VKGDSPAVHVNDLTYFPGHSEEDEKFGPDDSQAHPLCIRKAKLQRHTKPPKHTILVLFLAFNINYENLL
jgi:hypothetical protein